MWFFIIPRINFTCKTSKGYLLTILTHLRLFSLLWNFTPLKFLILIFGYKIEVSTRKTRDRTRNDKIRQYASHTKYRISPKLTNIYRDSKTPENAQSVLSWNVVSILTSKILKMKTIDGHLMIASRYFVETFFFSTITSIIKMWTKTEHLKIDRVFDRNIASIITSIIINITMDGCLKMYLEYPIETLRV